MNLLFSFLVSSRPHVSLVNSKNNLIFKEAQKSTCTVKLVLTLPHLQTLSDAYAADDFWKFCGKRRNCSCWNSPFAIMISTLFTYYNCIYREIHILTLLFSKSSATDLLYLGKGYGIWVWDKTINIKCLPPPLFNMSIAPFFLFLTLSHIHHLGKNIESLIIE